MTTIREQIESIRDQIRNYTERSYPHLSEEDKAERIMDLVDEFEMCVMKRERKEAQILDRMEASASDTHSYWLEATLREMDYMCKKQGIDKQDLADMLGVREWTYSSWVSGRAVPSPKSQKKIIACMKKLLEEDQDV